MGKGVLPKNAKIGTEVEKEIKIRGHPRRITWKRVKPKGKNKNLKWKIISNKRG